MNTTPEQLDLSQELADIRRQMAETARTYAEARKLDRERWWYPAIAFAALFGSGSAFTFLIIELTKRWVIQ